MPAAILKPCGKDSRRLILDTIRLGGWVQDCIAADQMPPSSLKPYDETQLDAEKFQAMKVFKSPFGKLHLYTAYTLLGMLLLHIAAVIVTDKREGGAIISAMFTGKNN